MKAWQVAVASAVVGVAVGCGVTWYEFFNVPEVFATSLSPGGGEPASAPRVKVVGGTTHVFGTMQINSTKSYEFEFVNEGNAPLVLSQTSTPPTCKCTQFVIPPEPIPPGKSAKVLLEWKPTSFAPDFKQSADVATNDPKRAVIPLTIKGSVVEFSRAIPDVISLGNMSADEGGMAQGKVFAYMADKLEIKSYEFLNAESAQFFDLTWEPLPASDVTRERIARSGLGITITAKPGLPLGSIDQTIRLEFEGSEPLSISIPISGTVASDVSVLGSSAFLKESQTLRLGVVKSSLGAKAELRLLVKGPHKDATTFKLSSIDPENALKASIGEAMPTSNGKAVIHILAVEVPPGSPTVNRIGSDLIKPGRIVIDTTHPEVKQISINVNFAVSEE